MQDQSKTPTESYLEKIHQALSQRQIQFTSADFLDSAIEGTTDGTKAPAPETKNPNSTPNLSLTPCFSRGIDRTNSIDVRSEYHIEIYRAELENPGF